MQKASLLLAAAVPFVSAGVLVLKFTGNDLASWALIVLGAVLGLVGGIQLALTKTPYLNQN